MSSTTSAHLKYFLPPSDGRRVYTNINADPVTGKADRSWVEDDHEAQIENVRGSEDDYTLDNSGFQFYRRPAKHTSASSAVIFDHTIRRHRPGEADDSPQRRQPVSLVHVDHTTASSIARVHRHLPPTDAPALLRRRFQIINLWRPISHAALGWPLALCDYRSVAKKDLIPVALIYPDREGEILGIRYNPNHKWKYLRGMEPDELVLIKCFDSVQDGSVAVMTPHTGFQDPTTPEDAPLRESIELRVLVFYD
ncbi:hypothetical protein SERLA73DRAFT_74833 [Serpula lacrymans var. lacrymans S7.3]|uniref:Uncharacterized protein n=2 Tax=Serpula lacrymans var. lacrymans TaxID=341189 RepID=F8Q3N2_SERL3|nr:uncharacterized protein SERLADRAFT_439503 [Serpula lacrymans var. lacrymans S7.9]EGN97117.1 hypothetical protein SERLA73DRAFT_74833 [Serpula lacrymans var. lacrymans S7.3]EGO22726.1 hypothetical protein SERLADRAFT_439503 [Serpula lacrymans var. lacrymans S7.9]